MSEEKSFLNRDFFGLSLCVCVWFHRKFIEILFICLFSVQFFFLNKDFLASAFSIEKMKKIEISPIFLELDCIGKNSR